MKINKNNNAFVAFLVFFSFLLAVEASASTGYIDTTAENKAKVCHDSTCATPTPGIINFELTDEPSIVIDTVTGITGRVWGNELGWITMNPTGAGVTFADPTSGLLTGKAWSQVSGWINFAVTGQSVTINPTTGEFDGWAWTGGPNGGWIKFDCAEASTCVKTTWRAAADGGGGPTSGNNPGGSSGTEATDVCSNIEGVQSSIPSGYTINNDGECVIVIDECPNLSGNQSAVPAGYLKNSLGACVRETSAPGSPTIDYCPNLPGTQEEVPEGYTVDMNGNCFEPSGADLCANLSGAQSEVPSGYYERSGNCFLLPESPDTIPPERTDDENVITNITDSAKTVAANFSNFIKSILQLISDGIGMIISWVLNFYIWIISLIKHILFLFLSFWQKLIGVAQSLFQ